MSDQFEILFDDPRVFSSETLLQEIKSILTDCSTKIDRLTMEVISIRSEVSAIKTKVYGRYQENAIEILEKPINFVEDFIKLESSLEDEIVFKKFKQELDMSCEKSYDKFIRTSWRRIFTDEVAQQFSWRGTATKKCIRGARVTLAIR
ncbi:PREDICTED: uncharacterized protein LOC108371570, partial [Rhagoletis zephyria]|uniref:uncharacterized protein LOC108371570 n=1 Tax=Rhagoletis zephyria TaxID=28612 RepID=UPI000811659A